MTTGTDISPDYLEAAAARLGYERIEWDVGNTCWSGYGSSDPTDRSRDDGGRFVAWSDDDLRRMVETLAVWMHGPSGQCKRVSTHITQESAEEACAELNEGERGESSGCYYVVDAV